MSEGFDFNEICRLFVDIMTLNDSKISALHKLE